MWPNPQETEEILNGKLFSGAESTLFSSVFREYLSEFQFYKYLENLYWLHNNYSYLKIVLHCSNYQTVWKAKQFLGIKNITSKLGMNVMHDAPGA